MPDRAKWLLGRKEKYYVSNYKGKWRIRQGGSRPESWAAGAKLCQQSGAQCQASAPSNRRGGAQSGRGDAAYREHDKYDRMVGGLHYARMDHRADLTTEGEAQSQWEKAKRQSRHVIRKQLSWLLD